MVSKIKELMGEIAISDTKSSKIKWQTGFLCVKEEKSYAPKSKNKKKSKIKWATGLCVKID